MIFFKKSLTNSGGSRGYRNLLITRRKSWRRSLNWELHSADGCKEREDFENQTPYIWKERNVTNWGAMKEIWFSSPENYSCIYFFALAESQENGSVYKPYKTSKKTRLKADRKFFEMFCFQVEMLCSTDKQFHITH